MADAPPDPITRVHNRLWEILDGFEPWKALVRDYVRFDVKDGFEQVFAKDYNANNAPLIMLTQDVYEGDPFAMDGSAVRLSPSFSLIVVAISLRVVPVNQIVWQTKRALHLAGPYIGLPGLIVNPVKFRAARFLGAGVNVAMKKETDRQMWQGTFYTELLIKHADVVSGNYPCATTSVPYGTP